MCDEKAQEDEGPEEGEIQDDDEEEASLYLSSSSSSYDRDIRNHERHRAARKFLVHEPSGSLTMSLISDRMLSRTNHDRRDKSRGRRKDTESNHHKTSNQPRSGLTHGKENRHVAKDSSSDTWCRGPILHHSARPSASPDQSPHGRNHTKCPSKRHRSLSDNTSSRSSEGAEREPVEREPVAPPKRRNRRRGGRRGKAKATSSEHVHNAKKLKTSHDSGTTETNDVISTVNGHIEASGENTLKRKLVTMGALVTQSHSTNSPPQDLNHEVHLEEHSNSSIATEGQPPPLEKQILSEQSISSAPIPTCTPSTDDVDNGVIFIAAVARPLPELVTLSDSDAEDTLQGTRSLDITKGTADMEMSRSSASSNVDMDLESTLVEISANNTSASIVQSDQDDDDIVSLRRAALMSKNKPTKDPPANSEQDEDDLQLRVEALRSAMLRKAEVRKKRRLQALGCQVPGDETTPVDMDLADTDEEDCQTPPSPERPTQPLPPPPMPSESLLKTVEIRPTMHRFTEPAAPPLSQACHFPSGGFQLGGSTLPLSMHRDGQNLLSTRSDLPRFPMDQTNPRDCSQEVADPLAQQRFPVDHGNVPRHPNEVTQMDHSENLPIVMLQPPNQPLANFPESPFPVHPPEMSSAHLSTDYQHPLDYPVLHPVPAPVPLEYSAIPLEYPPPLVPPVAVEYPVSNVDYPVPDLHPTVDYDPSVPTPYPESLTSYPDGSVESLQPPNFLSEDWNKEDSQADELEPLSQILMKAMKKSSWQKKNTRPNLLEIRVDPAPPNRIRVEEETVNLELGSMVILDEVGESPVSSPVGTTAHEPPIVTEKQPSIDEDEEVLLREKLLEAISSKRDQNKPQEVPNKLPKEPQTEKVATEVAKVLNPVTNKVLNPVTNKVEPVLPSPPLRKTMDPMQAEMPPPPARKPKEKANNVPQPLPAKSKTSTNVAASKVYSKADSHKVSVPTIQRAQAFPARKPNTLKQKAKTVGSTFVQQPSTTRFIIQLGEDSDSSDGLEGFDDTDELNVPKKQPWQQTNMYQMKDYCPRTGTGEPEKDNGGPSKAPIDETASSATNLRSEADLSKEVDKFLKDVRSSHEASAPCTPESPMASQPVKTTVHVTPLAVRHLPASKQEEYRKLKQMMAERELQKKTQRKIQSVPKPAQTQSKLNEVKIPTACNDNAMLSAPTPSTHPKTTKVPDNSATNIPDSPADRPLSRPAGRVLVPKKLLNHSGHDSPLSTSAPVGPQSSDFFRGAPIIYGQSKSPMVARSIAPITKAPVPVRLPAAAQPVRTPLLQTRSPGSVVPSMPSTSVPEAKTLADTVSSKFGPPARISKTPVPSSDNLDQEKLLEEAEMNLLKERSAVVGQIMGLTRLQDETENAMTAQDVIESKLLRIMEEFEKASKEWLEKSTKVKTLMQSVREKRSQLRGSYTRTETLARSCRLLGSKVKGAGYSLPVGSMMQSKQKAANQQFGRMIKWRKTEQKRALVVIDKADLTCTLLKSNYPRLPTIKINPTPTLVPNANPSTLLPTPLPPSLRSSISPSIPPTIPPSLPLELSVTLPSPPLAEQSSVTCSEVQQGKPRDPTALPLSQSPETPKLSAAPQTTEGDVGENMEVKNTPSMSCARRLVRVAKKRLREGGKPRDAPKVAKIVLGEDKESERKSSLHLTKYNSPLDHLGYSGSSEEFFDPEAILCPYELNGKCEDDECLYQHQAKDTNRFS